MDIGKNNPICTYEIIMVYEPQIITLLLKLFVKSILFGVNFDYKLSLDSHIQIVVGKVIKWLASLGGNLPFWTERHFFNCIFF